MGARRPKRKRPTLSPEEKLLLASNWPIIVIFGQSGAGKSSFINLLAEERQMVGHTIESCTSVVKFIPAKVNHQSVILVDTPGINDTRIGMSDADVLETIASCLEATGREQKWVTGILYLHSITNPRFDQISDRASWILARLCGIKAMKGVTFCTTRWDGQQQTEAMQRHLQLCDTAAIKKMRDKGAKTAQHSDCWANAADNAEKLVSELIDGAGPAVLAVQKQMIGQNKTVGQTDAGRLLMTHIGIEQAKVKGEMRRARELIQEESRDNPDADPTAILAEIESTATELKRQYNKLHPETESLCVIS